MLFDTMVLFNIFLSGVFDFMFCYIQPGPLDCFANYPGLFSVN